MGLDPSTARMDRGFATVAAKPSARLLAEAMIAVGHTLGTGSEEDNRALDELERELYIELRLTCHEEAERTRWIGLAMGRLGAGGAVVPTRGAPSARHRGAATGRRPGPHQRRAGADGSAGRALHEWGGAARADRRACAGEPTLMLGLGGDRRRSVELAHAANVAVAGPPSYVLTARPQDHGAMWPAVRHRCRVALPAGLEWASPLLSTLPMPVLCGREQARALYRWLDSLPTTAQVSVGCERSRPPRLAVATWSRRGGARWREPR